MKYVLCLCCFCAISFLSLLGYNKSRFQYDAKEALWRTIMTPFESTVFAPRYSEENFMKIKLGMTMDEVVKIVGEPLEGGCSQYGCSLIYSKQEAGNDDWDRRIINFDKITKRAHGIVHDFYID